ncbi:hypothetical protein pb186bvf_007367 [Paramecium bursaria]
MQIKKTFCGFSDRKAILELFKDIDQDFQQKLLRENNFFFLNEPTAQEISQLLTVVERCSPVKKSNWSSAQDKLLNIIVYGICCRTQTEPLNLNSLQWEQVARLFRHLNWRACRNRWLSERQYKVPWTQEEDKVLTELQQKIPNRWCEIAMELMKKCRTPYMRQGKQCRDRWVNKLDPNIVTIPWYKEEELKLFQEVQIRGKKWAEISLKVFKLRRTENTIKNRFYNLLKQEENRLSMYQFPKEEKEAILIQSVIEQLDKQIASHKTMFRLKEETNFDINNIYIVDESLNIGGEKDLKNQLIMNCLICLHPQTLEQLPCKHEFCRPCIIAYIENAVNCKYESITCPTCPVQINYKEYCPYLIINRDVICKLCQKPVTQHKCNVCKQCGEYHKGSCGHRCPQCFIPIEKLSGCNHITCQCKYEFCWICRGKFSSTHYRLWNLIGCPIPGSMLREIEPLTYPNLIRILLALPRIIVFLIIMIMLIIVYPLFVFWLTGEYYFKQFKISRMRLLLVVFAPLTFIYLFFVSGPQKAIINLKKCR